MIHLNGSGVSIGEAQYGSRANVASLSDLAHVLEGSCAKCAMAYKKMSMFPSDYCPIGAKAFEKKNTKDTASEEWAELCSQYPEMYDKRTGVQGKKIPAFKIQEFNDKWASKGIRASAEGGLFRNATPLQAMTLLIRGDLQDLTIPVADIDDASRKYREYVEREDLGSSEVAFGKVVMGGKLVATIKYNGRVQLENDDDSSFLESLTMKQLLARHTKMKCAGKGVFYCGCATAMEYQSRMQDAGMGAPR